MEKILQGTDSKYFYQLLSGRIRIPLYQRFYDWDEALIKQLLKDILQAWGIGKNLYLGAIISKEERGQDVIIDGQQRILTLMILLRALCDYLQDKKRYKNLFKIIHKKLGAADFDFEESIIIELNEESQGEFFKQCILKGESADKLNPDLQKAGKVFTKARELLQDELKEGLKRWKIEPGDLYKYINHRIELIKIDLSKAANESEIFEAINSKRQELSALDNIKNLIFRLTDKKYWPEVGNKWENLRKSFSGARDFDTFISHFATAASDEDREYTSKKPRILLSYFKDQLGGNSLGTIVSWNVIKLFFNKLTTYKEAYVFFSDPKHQKHQGDSLNARRSRASVLFSRQNKYTSHLPLLMRASYQAKDLLNNKVITLLAVAELIHFEGRIDGTLPQKTKDKFYKLLKQLKGKSLAGVVKSAKEKIKKKTIIGKIADLSEKGPAAAEQKIRYVLHRIISSNMPELLPRTFRELEHIMPQGKNLEPEWKKIMVHDIRNIKWREFEIEKEANEEQKKNFYRSRFIYSLGNCALLIDDINRGLQKGPIDKKLVRYKEEDNNRTLRWVIRHAKSGWDYKKILSNSKWLATEFVEVVLG